MLRAFYWLFPGGLVFLTTTALLLAPGAGGIVEEVTRGYPWVVFAGSFLLASFFHRSRVAVAVLALAAVTLVAVTGAGGSTAFFFAGGLYAAGLGALAFQKDRGVFTVPGALQLGGAMVTGLFGALVVDVAPDDMAAFLAAAPLPPELTAWSGLPQPVFLAFTLSFLLLGGAALLRRGPVERGMVWGLATVLPSFYLASRPEVVVLFFTAAGLTLGLSVLEISYAMAYRDDLTGLPARRALMRNLDALGGAYAVAMVDVDRFKRFNDRHGHDVGDQVLKMVAGRLARNSGEGRAFRYGGEEFTLLYPGKTRDEVLPRLEDVRKGVEEARFVLRSWPRPRKKPVNPRAWKVSRSSKPRELSVTVSIGVADSTGREATPEDVLKKADQALYRAKKKGRNRVAK